MRRRRSARRGGSRSLRCNAGDLSRLDTSAFVSALPGAGEADVETVPAGEIAGNAGNLSQMKTAAFVSARSGAGEADVETMPAGEIAGNGPWRRRRVAAAGPAARAAGEPGTSPGVEPMYKSKS